jgi:hypothetical protein
MTPMIRKEANIATQIRTRRPSWENDVRVPYSQILRVATLVRATTR